MCFFPPGQVSVVNYHLKCIILKLRLQRYNPDCKLLKDNYLNRNKLKKIRNKAERDQNTLKVKK